VDQDDDQMKALLAAVGEQSGPPLGFSADGIARRGRRVRAVRWAAGVTAAVSVVFAVTLTVALAARRDVEPANTPPTTVSTSTIDLTPNTTITTTTTKPTATTTTTSPTSVSTTSVSTTSISLTFRSYAAAEPLVTAPAG